MQLYISIGINNKYMRLTNIKVNLSIVYYFKIIHEWKNIEKIFLKNT